MNHPASIEQFLAERAVALAFIREELARRPYVIVDRSHAEELGDELLAWMPDLAQPVSAALHLALLPEARQMVTTALGDFKVERPECFAGSPRPQQLAHLTILEWYGATGTDAGMRESIEADCDRDAGEVRRRRLWALLRAIRERGDPLPDLGDNWAQPTLSGLPRLNITAKPKRVDQAPPAKRDMPKVGFRAIHR